MDIVCGEVLGDIQANMKQREMRRAEQQQWLPKHFQCWLDTDTQQLPTLDVNLKVMKWTPVLWAIWARYLTMEAHISIPCVHLHQVVPPTINSVCWRRAWKCLSTPPVEVYRANPTWMRPWSQTQKSPEGAHIPSGLATPRDPAGGSVVGERDVFDTLLCWRLREPFSDKWKEMDGRVDISCLL